MGKVSRRRIVTISATIALSSAALGAVGTFTSSPSFNSDTTSSSDTSSISSMVTPLPSTHSLSTAFSCGTHWRKARTCSTLCPTGQDAACPNGEYCHAGIPCTSSSESLEDTMDSVLQRQERMEQREVMRLKREREEEFVDRFVCGEGYVEAVESCAVGSSSPADDEGSSLSTAAAPQYCPTGSSSQCPSGMECYAAVSCPRDSHHDEVPLIDEEESGRLSDSLMTTTEQPPVFPSSLQNSTTTNNVLIEEGCSSSSSSSPIGESWTMFFQESIVSRTVSALSSHYGLN